ncbi:MAG: RNA polymerase sporulation sigma factor SigK [Clostridia bacterium]|nr:RNA polymerase sporulation sigma factor SigK [Clostridia bacterium]
MFLEVLYQLFSAFFLSGVVSSGNFPEPLSGKEERECLEKMKSGDKEARGKLIEHNLRLVAHIVKKYSQTADIDDLISIGTVGLIKAVDSFDSDKNTRLATYASRCVENEVLMHLRHEKKFASQLSLSEPIGYDREGNEISLMDILVGDGEDICDKVDKSEKIKKLFEKVRQIKDKREKAIIYLRYGLHGGEPLTQKEVAKKLGISRSYVSRIEKKAIMRLRES